MIFYCKVEGRDAGKLIINSGWFLNATNFHWSIHLEVNILVNKILLNYSYITCLNAHLVQMIQAHSVHSG